MFNGIKQFGSQGAAIAKLAMLQKKIQNTKMEVEMDGVKAVVTGDGKLKELQILSEAIDEEGHRRTITNENSEAYGI